MKKRLLAYGLALGLAACATAPTPFAPAQGTRGYGYSEQQIERDRFRVTWRGIDHPNATGEDLALLRAADLTLAQKDDWFQVVSRTDTTQSLGSTVTVGSGGGDIGGGSVVGFGIGTAFNLGGPPLRTITLEVLMAKGTPPHERGAYDAHDVSTTVRPRL